MTAAPALPRFALAAVVALLAASTGAAAVPRDEALRLAPPDAAFVLLIQDARQHVRNFSESPFVEWFPTSKLGKQLLASPQLKDLRQSVAPVFNELGTTPEEVLNDVVGEAVVFAFSPAPTNRPTDERAVILIRPRKPETLARILDRVNATQTKSGELKGVAKRSHNGEPYFERQKAGGSSEFYCFRGPVFAFSSSEADILAVIDRDGAAAGAEPELTARLKRLGVDDALAVVLLNPRPLDAELDARVAAAKLDEKAFLERFREVWKATEMAAVYVALGRDLEAGLSVRFDPQKLPAWARGWVTGPKTPSALWSAVPDDALFAAGARFRASELLDLILLLLPEDGKKTVNAVLAESLGPVVGRDKLPVVLSALGPDWVIWVEPPRGDGFLPVAVGGVRISSDDPEIANAIVGAVEDGFRAFRVLYNANHPDQIELRKDKDGDTTITVLVNDKGFPPGFRPAFAVKGGYLIVASDPDAIRRFRPPTGEPKPDGEVVMARFNGSGTRAYLEKHGTRVAGFLAAVTQGNEGEFAELFNQVATGLEPLDKVELVVRGDEASVRIAVRVKFVKPLKKD
jgi:hypothetical protein